MAKISDFKWQKQLSSGREEQQYDDADGEPIDAEIESETEPEDVFYPSPPYFSEPLTSDKPDWIDLIIRFVASPWLLWTGFVLLLLVLVLFCNSWVLLFH